MKIATQLTIAALLAAAGAGGTARAQSSTVPQMVTYQGSLRTSQGLPYPTGTYQGQFSLWTVPTGGAMVWGQGYTFSVLTNGEFNVLLGDSTSTPLPPTPVTNTISSAGGTLVGSATLSGGTVQLTPAASSTAGNFFLNDLTPGYAVSAFSAQFGAIVNSGSSPTYADGYSFNFMGENPSSPAVTNQTAEYGLGNGLSVCFHLYNTNSWNNGNLNDNYVTLNAQGVVLATNHFQFYNLYGPGGTTPLVQISMNANQQVTVIYNGTTLWNNYQVSLQPAAGWRFGWGGRCGGDHAQQQINDVSIATTTSGLTLSGVIQNNPNLWMGIVLTSTPDGPLASPSALAPRQQWVSSAYSLKSSMADATIAIGTNSLGFLSVTNLNPSLAQANGLQLVGVSNGVASYLPVAQSPTNLLVQTNLTVAGPVTVGGIVTTAKLLGPVGSTLSLGGASVFASSWTNFTYGATNSTGLNDMWLMVVAPYPTTTGNYNIYLRMATPAAALTTNLLYACNGGDGVFDRVMTVPLPANCTWSIFSGWPTNNLPTVYGLNLYR